MMMKRDLKSAFRHVSVNSCDYWLLFFEWQRKFYVNMFLFFELRTSSRIFNLFVEALHWIFEILQEWNVTHYLDDFLIVFFSNTNLDTYFNQFDEILFILDLFKAAEKDVNECVIMHLDFEFNFINMKIRLSQNKKQRVIDALSFLLSSSMIFLSNRSRLWLCHNSCDRVILKRLRLMKWKRTVINGGHS